MKFRTLFYLFVAIVMAGCGQSNRNSNKKVSVVDGTHSLWQPPAAGSEVAEIKEKIREDQLNHLYFSVHVFSTDSSKEGIYEVQLDYGYGQQKTTIQLPELMQGIYPKPLLRKGKGVYVFDLGFNAADTIFHPYYKIKLVGKTIKMNQIWAYRKIIK